MAKHYVVPIKYRDGTILYFDTRGWVTVDNSLDRIYPKKSECGNGLKFCIRNDLIVEMKDLISITLGVVAANVNSLVSH